MRPGRPAAAARAQRFEKQATRLRSNLVAEGALLADQREAADLGGLLALAAAPHEQARGGADAAGGEEAQAERAACDERELRAELSGDVGRLAELLAQRVDGVRELLALRLELAADVLLASGHS